MKTRMIKMMMSTLELWQWISVPCSGAYRPLSLAGIGILI